MSIHKFLESAYLLQTFVLALSIFNLVAFLWLAVTVWLNGDRKSGIARLGVIGLSLSALFFFIHALLISGPLTQASGLVTPEFLWHLIWLPALGVPYIWFAIGLYYAALINAGWRKRRPYLLALSGVLGCIVLLLLIINQSTFTYEGTLRLIAYNDALNDLSTGRFSPMVLIPVLFLCYVTFCAIGPWFTFGRMSRLLRVLWVAALSLPERLRKSHTSADNQPEAPSFQQALLDAFWDDPTDVELLEEPYLSWHLARPGLLLAALLMAALTTTLGILVIQSIVNWIQYGQHNAVTAIPQPPPSGLVLVEMFPINLIILDLAAGTLKRNFSYRWPHEAVLGSKMIALNKRGNIDAETPKRIQITLHGQSMICWVLPIFDERGLVAALYLGPREDGGAFTEEDMDLAQACGQRILDTLGDHEAMQAVAGLLRRRTVDVKLLGAQQRRVLHDEILPQMHLALLRLETLRSTSEMKPGDPESAASSEMVREQGLNEAIDMISDAHRRLATMMRTTAPGAPHRLERDGMMHAIQTMLEQDFQNAFDEIEWCVSEETATAIDEVTPPAIAELIFAAVQEALRNAARHARGNDVHRHLRLTLSASYNRDGHYLEVIVADDGVGIISASSATTGTGGGLLTHSALLAIAGGNLNIKSSPGEGVTVKIVLPAESLR